MPLTPCLRHVSFILKFMDDSRLKQKTGEVTEGAQIDLDKKAWMAFQECATGLDTDQLAVELRPRFRDMETAFSGDYDYLMDGTRFEEIVRMFFSVCLSHGVTFQVLRRSTFKHKVILFGAGTKRIIFEFWPHAELTTDSHGKGESFLAYKDFVLARAAGLAEETLALLFISHLFYKKKDLSNEQNQWRLREFTKRMEQVAEADDQAALFAGKVGELLAGIISGDTSLVEANRKAIELMAEGNIQLASCGMAKRARKMADLRRSVNGLGGRIVPCVGPDGSGKTYFISAVMELVKEHTIKATTLRFKNLFRRNKIYSHINKRYRTPRDLAKNNADEKLAHLVGWFALPAYCWQILTSLKMKAVFMDRFFLEFMVRGYRENAAIKEIKAYSLLCKLIPEPRKMIVLTASDELIFSRKAELSSASIEDFYSRYISFVVERKVPNVLFLYTQRSGRDLAECCLTSIGLLKVSK